MAGPVGIGAFLEIAAGAASAYPKVQKVLTGLQATSEFLGTVSKNARVAKRQIMDMLDTVGGRWVKMNDIAFKTARTMAMSREQAIRYNQQLIQSTKELATQYGISAKELANFQKSYSEAIGRNVVLTREQLAHMSALSKITDEATAAQLVDEFDKIGISIESGLAHVGHMQEKAKAFGVNATKATQLLRDNIKLAASYSFKNGVADIEKMAIKSASLRMDMNAVMNAADKFMDIEGAIGTSARLQMLGGSFGAQFSNPMGAMYEAMADPEAFMGRLEKLVEGKASYNSKTGEVKFDPVTMMQLREAAKQLGMSVDQLTNPAMAKAKDNAVMQQMGEKWGQFSEEQQKAIQNLARGNFNAKTGKYEIKWLDKNGEHTKNVEEITAEELKIAQDSQATEENMMMDVKDIKTILERVHGRARETKSFAETTEGMSSWWDAQITNIQDTYMPFFSGLYNNFSNWLGKQYANGGIVEPIHAETGTIVPGTSYTGDKVPAMVNSGEMILNKNQQKSMFGLLSSLAVTGGAAYGMNKLGGKIGYGSLGSTMFLANMLGGGKTDLKSMIEAHFIMKAVKSMKPLKTSIVGLGNASEAAAKTTTAFQGNWKELTNTLSKDWKSLSNAISSGFSGFAKKMSTATKKYFTTGRLGKVTSTVGQAGKAVGRFTASAWNGTAKYAKMFGDVVYSKAIKPLTSTISTGWNSLKDSKFYRTRVAEAQLVKAKGLDFLDRKTQGIRGKYDTLKYKSSELNRTILKPKAQQYKQLVKNLFNDGSKAQASKAASRLQTPEVAMTGRHTGISNVTETVSKEASTMAKAASKGGKLFSGIGKGAKMLGKKLPYIGTALAVGSAVSGMLDASSQYDKQVDEIEKSGMSDRDKARAKDRAIRERNGNMGGSVGSAAGGLGGMAAGAAAGAAIGSIIPGFGTAIGGLIGGALGAFGGEKLGGVLGKGVGSLFGGSEEEKFLEEQKESAKAIAGNNEEIIKVLKSIEGKMPGSSKIGSNFGLKPLELESSVIQSLPLIGPMMTGIKAVGGLIGGNGASAGVGNADINLNVSGTIKLEGSNKSVDLDLNKLLDTPEFKRQLTDIISKRLNEVGNAGKTRNETSRNNTANIYNKNNKG